MNFIKLPNLPSREVTLAAVSSQAEELIGFMEKAGITAVKTEPAGAISDGTAAHADLNLLHLGFEHVVLSSEQGRVKTQLETLGFKVSILSSPLGGKYPADVPLNAAILGDTVFFNPATVGDTIDFGFRRLLPVRQGYTKCSVCAVSENALITDDPGIYTAARKNGFDVLLVSKGDVALQGQPYGFIGGCSGLIAPGVILFSGSIGEHRDAQKIEDFLKKHKVRALCSPGRLTDVGGILPLGE